ncbi:hypothetical protein GCM10028785_30730 [Hydrogenophaga soli]
MLQRGWLAEWLWSSMPLAEARRNLRVVLSDAQQALRNVGLDDCLRVDRDWVRWNAGVAVDSTSLAELLAAARAGDTAEGRPQFTDVSEDLVRWLGMWSPEAGSDADRAAKTVQPSPNGEASPGSSEPVSVPQQPRIHLVSLLRLNWSGLVRLDDHQTHESSSNAVLPTLKDLTESLASRSGGQRCLEDSSGVTYMFGLESLSPSFRSTTVQVAGQLEREIRLLTNGQSVQMGICFGPVLRQPDSGVSGWRFRLAERLAQSAEQGELVCDQSFEDMAQCLGFHDDGERRFRGFQRGFRLFRTRLSDIANVTSVLLGQSHQPLVGRDAFLATCMSVLKACSSGASRALVVRAPTGMGKTRVALELWRLHRQSGGGVVWVEGRPETSKQPWAALREAVTQHLMWDVSGLNEVHLQLLRAFVVTGSVAQSDRMQLRQAIARLVSQQTLLWVVDDAQWLDDTSAQFLGTLSQELPSTLWLLTVRGDLDSDSSVVPEWLGPGMTQVLDLSPLADPDALKLLAMNEQREDADGSTEAQHAQSMASLHAARGRPLYLVCEQAGGMGPHFAAHCQARVNALGDVGRSLLEVAAILGSVWLLNDLHQLCPGVDVREVLAMAEALDLVVFRGETTGAFFHPTVREFFLDSQPVDSRQARALQVAAFLDSKGEDARAAQCWEFAGQSLAAMVSWQRAASKAMACDDHHAALAHFSELRRLGYTANRDAVESVPWRLAHAQARLVVQGYGDALVNQLAHEMEAAMRDAPPTSAEALPEVTFGIHFLAYMSSSSNGHVDGMEHARRLAVFAEGPPQQLIAAWAHGNTCFWRGDTATAQTWFERMFVLADAVPLSTRTQLFVSDPVNFGRVQWIWLQSLMVGDAQHVARADALAHEHARYLPLPQDLAIYHCISAFRCFTEGNAQGLCAHASQARNIAEAENYRLWQGVSGLQWALGQALLGQPHDEAALQADLQALGEGYAAGIPTGLWMLADLRRASGRHEDALLLCDEWLARFPQTEHRHCLMDIHRIRAQVLHTMGRMDDGASAWQQARDVAVGAGLNGWLQRWQREFSAWA